MRGARRVAAGRGSGGDPRRDWATDPLLGPSVRAAPGAASPGTRTRPSSPCARCSASRSRWPPRARSRGGWWRRPASRWSGRWAGITHRFPTPEALAALDPGRAADAARPRPRARGHGGPAVRRRTCRGWGRGRRRTSRCARATTTRSCRPTWACKHGLSRAGRRPASRCCRARRGVAPLPGLRGRASVGGGDGELRWVGREPEPTSCDLELRIRRAVANRREAAN